jgi:hypothetical protein
MGTKKITLSLGKRLSCGLALSGILLSACVFGFATAQTTETKVAKPVRILLTDDTPDSTLSIRRKTADQRNIAKLYNNDLRPKKDEPKQLVETEVKPAPPAEIVTPKVIAPKVVTPIPEPPKIVTPKPEPPKEVTPIPAIVEPVEEITQAKPEKNGLDSILTTLTFPKFNIIADIDTAFNAIGDELSIAAKSPSDISPTNNHTSKFRQTQSNREPRPSAGSVDQANADLPPSNQNSEFRQTQSNRGHGSPAGSTNHAKSDLPDIPSFDTLLPTIEISKVDLFGDIESAFSSIGNELSSASTSAASPHVSKYDSKMKHPGRFTPRYANRSTAAPVHMPTIGSLDGIQFPKIMLADINSIFGIDTAPSVEEDVKNPAAAPDELQEESKESAPNSIEDKQSAVAKEPRSIIALLGLEDLGIPQFSNPFAVGTGIKETKENVEPAETKDTKPALDENGLDPDETIASELPSLQTDRPDVPGVQQIPTLAPKEIPDAPNAIDEQDKSASRDSSYKTLVNPDSFLPRRSVVPVSVRISDTVNR